MPTDYATDTNLTFLELARLRFKRCSEAENAQRKAMLKAKKFRAGDQWDDAIKVQRSGGQAIQGQAAEPPRPFLTIDRISAPVRQVSNTVRAANFAIDVHPNGFGADDETARILKGLLRQIQNDARGEDPIEWAADGAAESGIGWFRVYADYCYDDPERVEPEALRDQDLKIGRIANNLSVYCDPSSRMPTRSDAGFMIVTEDMNKQEFGKRYGTDKLIMLDEFRSTGDQDKWVGDDVIRIAEYWTCDYVEVKVYQSPDGTVTVGETPEDYDAKEQGWWTRTIRKPKVKCAKITACHVLEKWDWPGTRIPLFPVLGEELNVDGKICLRGVVESAIDPQRMVNWLYSGAVEQVALSNKSPFIVAAGQIDNYKALWQKANTTNLAYLPYDPVSIAGTVVEKPHREVAEPPIQAIVEMLHISEEAIKATTSIYDPSLGNTNPREKSGRAIMALQQQAEHANSNYVDNVQRAMVDCGNELVKLCPVFYDRPGRVLKIAGISDQPEQVTIGPSGGSEHGVLPNQAPQTPGPTTTPQQAEGMQQFYDLSKGNYSVTVGVSKAHSTKREETNAIVGELISSNPQLMGVFGDIFFRNLEQPELEDRAKKMLAPQVQQGKDGQPDPAAMQAQMAQAAQMIDMMGKELQAKTQVIETDQIKSNERIKEKQIDADTRKEVARIQAGATIGAADIKAGIDEAKVITQQLQMLIDAAKEVRLEHHGAAHDVALQAMDHAHELKLAQHEAAVGAITQGASQEHEAGMTAAQQAHEAEQSDADRQAAAEQAKQKAE